MCLTSRLLIDSEFSTLTRTKLVITTATKTTRTFAEAAPAEDEDEPHTEDKRSYSRTHDRPHKRMTNHSHDFPSLLSHVYLGLISHATPRNYDEAAEGIRCRLIFIVVVLCPLQREERKKINNGVYAISYKTAKPWLLCI